MRLRSLCCALVLAATAHAPLAASDEAIDVRRLMRHGDTAAALQLASAAAAAQPGNAELRFLKGVILIDLQRDAEALEVFTRLSQDFPELADPYNNIAMLQARAGRWDHARVALETALRNHPGHAVARENLGDVHLQLALQAWNVAAEAGGATTTLQRKLRLGREIASPVAGSAAVPQRTR